MNWIKKIRSIPLSELKFVGILAGYLIAIGLLARILPVKDYIQQLEDTGIQFMLCFWMLFVVRGLFLLVAVMLSATLSFWLGRSANKIEFFNKFSNRAMNNGLIYNRMKDNGYKSILIINAMGISFDVPNYLAGHFKLNFFAFLGLIVSINLLTTMVFVLIITPLQTWIMG